MTKVFNLFQLERIGEGDKPFSIAKKSKLIRNVKISQDLADNFNANAEQSGKYYEVDEAETERLFGKQKETTTELTPDQIKYNKRKEKMIKVGYVLGVQDKDEDIPVFTKGEIVILAQDLLNMPPAKFGKLIK